MLVCWAHQHRKASLELACQAACSIVRLACAKAYTKKRRALVAPDVIDEVGEAFDEIISTRASIVNKL